MVPQRFLRLDGFTKVERIQMTNRVSEAINQAGAWINVVFRPLPSAFGHTSERDFGRL
jgi:hypothetical protein